MGYKDEVSGSGGEVKEDVTEALKFCDLILRRIEDLPERAFEFGASVEEKVTGMRKWIDEKKHVTPKMQAALENIYSGMKKWLREADDDD
jgi:hypothetical protein